jgi:hypothetical protein
MNDVEKDSDAEQVITVIRVAYVTYYSQCVFLLGHVHFHPRADKYIFALTGGGPVQTHPFNEPNFCIKEMIR